MSSLWKMDNPFHRLGAWHPCVLIAVAHRSQSLYYPASGFQRCRGRRGTALVLSHATACARPCMIRTVNLTIYKPQSQVRLIYGITRGWGIGAQPLLTHLSQAQSKRCSRLVPPIIDRIDSGSASNPMRVIICLTAPCDWFVLPVRVFPLVFVNRKYANVY